MRCATLAIIGLLCSAHPVSAGETPLYEPAPSWVVKLDSDPRSAPADAPPLLLLDSQQRIEDGRHWAYTDMATRVATVELLNQMSTLTLPWMPDKGDLIVHEITLTRGDQVIDLLAAGKRLTVLRREEALENRELTGMLTATLSAEGVQVGDILRLRYSITSRDAALNGHVQEVVPLIALPYRLQAGRVRVQWHNRSKGRANVLAGGVAATPVRRGEFFELAVPLPIPKQTEMPSDAPTRFQRPPMLEFSTFASWADVSRTMAPLYRTEGLIAPDGPLAGELAALKSEADPLARAQQALRLVQDRIRYLAVSMNGGNYVPQKPEETWLLRYGDCKAKTLLLLALLHASGIEADAVVTSMGASDLVPERLPSAAAFDHVLVRAVIDGRELWLDGTGSGARLEDIHDTPPVRFVLPLRAAGAEPMAVAYRKPARPFVDITVDADESTSVDLPMAFTAQAVLRGNAATSFTLLSAQLEKRPRDQMIQQFFTGYLGEGQYTDFTVATDSEAATVTLGTRGVTASPWRRDNKRMKRWLARSLLDVEFKPDRARASWQGIPVATHQGFSMRMRLRLRLPENGRGMTLEGAPSISENIAGWMLTRSSTLENGVAIVDERLDTTGAEVAVAEVPKVRDQLSVAQSRIPRLIAPLDAMRRWNLAGKDPAGSGQLAAIKAVYAKSIPEAEADEISSYTSRASLLIGVGDRNGALADFDKIISIAPSAESYLRRAELKHSLGHWNEAIADAEKALSLDPAEPAANGLLANLLAERGELPRATALLDGRIALGGEAADVFREIKASLLGEFGEPQAALALLDELAETRPGNAALLNARCWIMGTRSILIDEALKDCTRAIELSSSTAAALDSRALVWFRLGRFEETLRDLDAALLQIPAQGQSRFMRGVVLNRLGRPSEAATELTLARRLAPQADRTYARYGIKP